MEPTCFIGDVGWDPRGLSSQLHRFRHHGPVSARSSREDLEKTLERTLVGLRRQGNMDKCTPRCACEARILKRPELTARPNMRIEQRAGRSVLRPSRRSHHRDYHCCFGLPHGAHHQRAPVRHLFSVYQRRRETCSFPRSHHRAGRSIYALVLRLVQTVSRRTTDSGKPCYYR